MNSIEQIERFSTDGADLARPDDLVGRPLSRLDGPRKVFGEARFAAEVVLEGMLYASVVHSRIARGRIEELDTTRAESAPGVALVMTYRNAPRMQRPAVMNSTPDAGGSSSLPVMQDDAIHWNGEPVAVVLADTQEQADHAASLVRVRYAQAPAVVSFDEAKAAAREPDNVLGEPSTIALGDAESALRDAPVRVDQVYRTPRYNHNAIELHGLTVAWNGDELVMHDSTQMISSVQATIADVFGIPRDKIRVLSPFVGGGFGGKTLWSHQILAVAAARLAGRPVRLVLSREGVYRAVGGRTITEQRVALGARADGTLAALIHTGVAATTPYNDCPEQFTFPARHLYRADALLLRQQVADMDMVANTYMRAPGESIGTFALESALDELAHALSMDPIELRRRIEPATDPTSGRPFSSRHLVEAYARGAERFGWKARNPVPGARREGEWLIGMGVATATYPYYRMPGAAARVRLTAQGRAEVCIAAHEMGMGTSTAQAQHAAQRLGLPLEQITFECGDSAFPPGTIAGGSSQTVSIAAAVQAACDTLNAKLIELAGPGSPLAGLTASEVEAAEGGLRKRGDPSRTERYAEILLRAGRDEITCEAAAPPPQEMADHSMHSYGAQFCEVRVSAVTGEVRMSRMLGSFDAGCIINPKTAASQFRGGMVMGLGLALMEHTLFDERTGRIMNPSLAEYHVPVHMDVPVIDVIWNDIPDPHSPLGARGIGEIGITGVGAAVANAVFNATGKRIRELPLTLDKLYADD